MKNQHKIGLFLFLAGLTFATSVWAQTAPNISYATPQTYTINVTINTLSPGNTGGAPAITGQTSTMVTTGLSRPSGVTIDLSGNIYLTDAGNQVIKKITPSGTVTVFAGSGTAGYVNGTGTAASFNNPQQMCTDASGNIYVADQSNNMIRKISPAAAVVTLAGSSTAGF